MKQDNSNQNPWAGLSSYEDPAKSEQKLKFCGRDNETKEVTRLIDDNFFVTLYGKSGIGKTSLLNAGVFPALRREQYTPLSLRLGMTDGTQTFQDIITTAIEHTIEECGGSVRVINVVEEQTDRSAIDYLWNWFARHYFLRANGQATFPVIVFDQFEEVFRHQESRQKTEVLLTQLHFLIDESHALNDCIVNGEQYYYDFNFRFVLSIREDDLYRLEDSIDNCALTALKRCRYRLRSLSEQSAEAVILVPGEGFIKEDEQKGIVDTIIGIARNKEDKSISTNVLSLICNRIFVDFLKSGADHITPSLVDSFIKGNPFERFYNEATRGFSNREKAYIETNLVDSTGRRNSISESDYHLHVKNGSKLLKGDTCILQRISTSSDGGNYRIELIHDSFCESLSKQKEKREKRRRLWQLLGTISVAILSIAFIVYILGINYKMDLNMSRVLAEKANQLTDSGDSYLARLIALQALPPNRPYTAEADGALHKASLYNSAILKGHTSFVKYASFSPDGKFIVSSSFDGEIRIWDAENGRQVGNSLKVNLRSVNSASFSPDGKYVVSACNDGIRIWEVKTGRQVKEIFVRRVGTVDRAFFSPDGNYIVYDGNGIWDLKKGKIIMPTLEGRYNDSNSVFSPDGNNIVTIFNDNTIRLWDLRTGQQVGQPLKGHSDLIYSASFSHNGKYVVSASKDRTIRIWDVKTCTQVDSIRGGYSGYFTSASFSPDDRYIVSIFHESNVSTSSIDVWDVNTCTKVGESLRGHTKSITSAIFSPNGKFIVSASYDETIRIWDMKSIVQQKNILKGHTNSVLSVSFSPDSKYIASASFDNTVRIWDVEKKCQVGKPLTGHTGTVRTASFSPDGKYVVSASNDSTIRIWDVEKKSQVGDPLKGHTDDVKTASFSPDGNYIVSASSDKTIRIWDAKKGTQIVKIIVGSFVRTASFSPDGKYIVFVVSSGEEIRFWDVKKESLIEKPLEGHTSIINSASFSPDGKYIVSSSYDKTVRIWDMRSGNQVGKPLTGHTDDVRTASFSPDGKYVVSASNDKTVRIWDVETKRQVGDPLEGHTDMVFSASFSPDGKYIASASRDGTIRIWYFPTYDQLVEKTRERFKSRQLSSEERQKYYIE